MELFSYVTDTQKGLYYIQKANPESAAYNVTFVAKVLGGIDRNALQKALLNIQSRHQILRQTFVEKEGELYLCERPELKLTLSTHDLTALSAADAKRSVFLQTKKPFQLEQQLCVRVELFQLNNDEQVLLICAHHASFDFWSLALLLSELKSFYQASEHAGVRTDQSSELPLPIQFNEYVTEYRALQEDEKYQESKSAIAESLEGCNSVLALSTDFSRVKFQPYSGASFSFVVPADLSAKLQQVAKSYGATTYMFLLASFQILLHRYTGQTDILVGTPVAGREKRRYRNVMGNFVNTIVLRSQCDESLQFPQHLSNTIQRVVAAIRHQSVPFAQVVEMLKIKPDPSRSPLVQANFAWDKLPQLAEFEHFFSDNEKTDEVEWGDLTMAPYWLPQQEGQFDIALEMGGSINGELTATLKYRDDLFSAETISRFAANFVHLLQSLCEASQQNIATVNWVTSEQSDLLKSLALSNIDVPKDDLTLLDLIAHRVASHPDASAIEDSHSRLSYLELDRRSTLLAQVLQKRFNVNGLNVGICMARNNDLVVCLLAIMKAGAAYVPVDPSLPTNRAQQIVEDARLAVLLIDNSVSNLAEMNSCPLQQVENLFGEMNTLESNEKALKTIDAARTAYIIFTSGSTGRPKGVCVSHKNVANLLRSFAVSPGFNAEDSLLAVTTISFDISVLELFLPLIVGGKTIILDAKTSAMPDELMESIDAFKPTFMQATPATWKMLLSAGWQGKEDLTIFCGGEALPQTLAEKLSNQNHALYNVYGPTETTIWSTYSHYTGGKVSIGRPIANTQTYVLDPQGQLVPQNVVGELHIAGLGVTQGYFEQPELTAKAFVDNPFGEGKLYKTGDLARLNSQGQLECLGRIGNQVKVRGFRIELDDVEENIRRYPPIADVAVSARIIHDDMALVCYYVVKENETLIESELKLFLKSIVPAYMVPSFYQPMESLPTTSNGKVDRNKLPQPDDTNVDRVIYLPTNQLEEKLLNCWSAVLKLSAISITDDFYDIGGHSLLAVQLVSKIKQELEVDIDNQFTLTNTTIQDMARAIAAGDITASSKTLVKFNLGQDETLPLFLMHPIGGTVHCYQGMVQSLAKTLPVYAFQSPGIDDADEIEVGIESIVAKYIDEIIATQPQGPYRLGGWCFGGVLAYEAANQLIQQGKEVEAVYVFDTRAPIVANHPDDGDDATLLSWFARDLAVPHNKVLNISPEQLRAIDVDEQFDFVLQKAAEIGVIEEGADVKKLMNYFQVYVANGMALQMYPEQSINVELVLYRAIDEASDYGEFLGWDKLLGNQFTMVDVSGDHNSIMYKPQVGAIADDLNSRLLHNSQFIRHVG